MTTNEPTAESLLADFIHYTRIARLDLARSFGQALLDRKLSNQDFVKLVEGTGNIASFEKEVLRAQRITSLSEVAGGLLSAFNKGKLEIARDPAEIGRSISLLTGTQSQRLYARERIAAAGEYALPQLLNALLQRNDGALRAEAELMMTDSAIARQAIIPLVTALDGLDPVGQEQVAAVLGRIQYPTSVPFLYDLHRRTESSQVKSACERSIQRITGVVSPEVPIADRFYLLANEYYAESKSLTSFAGEEFQLVWAFDTGLGLLATPVRTEVYHEAMAMRLCERALALDGGHAEALSLWIASNFSREIDSPAEYQNPVHGADRRDAMFYAVAAGPVADQRVLGRAINSNDTPLARRAIEAIERTAGGTGLWETAGVEGNRQPLLEALSYPNRRVQYEAALAIGAAQPAREFGGSDRVAPILAGALREASARFALVIAKDLETGNSLSSALASQGYTMLPASLKLADAETAIAECPGVDLIVLSGLTSNDAAESIKTVRGRAKLAATPIAAFLSAQGFAELAGAHHGDATTRISRDDISGEQQMNVIAALMDAAVGGAVTEDEARTYQNKSIRVLRDLAMTGNPALRVSDVTSSLISSLGSTTGALRVSIAEVLSFVGGQDAQSALMDSAMGSAGDERLTLLGLTASSAKRFGNLLSERQIQRLVDLVGTAQGEEAVAAAALMGALNLPNAQVLPLISGK